MSQQEALGDSHEGGLTVGVPHGRREAHRRGKEGELRGEGESGLEETSLAANWNKIRSAPASSRSGEKLARTTRCPQGCENTKERLARARRRKAWGRGAVGEGRSPLLLRRLFRVWDCPSALSCPPSQLPEAEAERGR